MTTEVTDAVDVAAYFGRIGYRGPAEPTVETVHALVAAHNRSIPFETSTRCWASLSPTQRRRAHRQAGAPPPRRLLLRAQRTDGICARRGGFGVERLAGRVVWMNPGGPLPAQTHHVLSVTVPGVDGLLLVDVGFGGQTLTSPIRLQPGPVQETRHEPYRIRERDDGYQLEAEISGEWQPLYMFTNRPQPRIDLEVGSWYVSTNPNSHFVTGLTAALVTDDARWNMRGRNLAVHRAGNTEKIRFDSAADVLDALTDRFGIDVADLGDRADVEARVSEVLDS
jgi:arylamine N-acetyltransferase